MTKQEEIREGTARRLRGVACFRIDVEWDDLEQVEWAVFRADAKHFLSYLHDNDVVIKVCDADAGYVVVEPLVTEG